MKKTAFQAGRVALVALGVVGLIALWSGPASPISAQADGFTSFRVRNPIDQFILSKLKEYKIEPSEPASDAEFLRRVYLDIVGMIPTPSEVKVFLADKSPTKREKVVDFLLKDPRYGAHWASVWGDLLREHSNGDQREGTVAGSYREWLKNALNSNMPYDKFVTELIVSSGRADQNGAVNFYLRDTGDRVETVNTVAQAFMGTRMSCAQCHDHPFDSWEQKDFHSLMAFLAPRVSVTTDVNATVANLGVRRLPKEFQEVVQPFVEKAQAALKAEVQAEEDDEGGATMGMGMDDAGKGRKPGRARAPNLLRDMQKAAGEKLPKEKAERLRQIVNNSQIRRVSERAAGDYRMPSEGDEVDRRRASGEIVEPVFPWDPSLQAGARESRREALARYVTGSRRAAEVQVNRIWAKLFGRGIVDPVDDFRPKNPPSHPELLAYLADEFTKSKFDSKHIVKLIVSSHAYGLSTKPNESNKDDKALFSHARLRRMNAEQIHDSILISTGRTAGLSELGKPLEVDYTDVLMEGAPQNGRRPGNANGRGRTPFAFDQRTPAPNGSFFNLFNQPDREQLTIERDESGSISQALELLNGSTINQAVKIVNGTLSKSLVDAKADADTVAVTLYLATLSRFPTDKELNVARLVLKGKPPAAEAIEDFHWALLNTREFMFIR